MTYERRAQDDASPLSKIKAYNEIRQVSKENRWMGVAHLCDRKRCSLPNEKEKVVKKFVYSHAILQRRVSRVVIYLDKAPRRCLLQAVQKLVAVLFWESLQASGVKNRDVLLNSFSCGMKSGRDDCVRACWGLLSVKPGKRPLSTNSLVSCRAMSPGITRTSG